MTPVPDQIVTLVKELWWSGLSASRTALEISVTFHLPFSRNSVIGLVHRNKMLRPGQIEEPIKYPRYQDKESYRLIVKKRPPRPKSSKPTKMAQQFNPSVPGKHQPPFHSEIESTLGRITIIELTDQTCRWPMAHNEDGEMTYCGDIAPVEKPYCELHQGISCVARHGRR
jgi:GcrA cell cycle regulator